MNTHGLFYGALQPWVFHWPQEPDQAFFGDGSNLVGKDYGVSGKTPYTPGYKHLIGIYSPPFFEGSNWKDCDHRHDLIKILVAYNQDRLLSFLPDTNNGI